MMTGSTSNHMIVVNSGQSFGLDGRAAAEPLDTVSITTNKQISPDHCFCCGPTKSESQPRSLSFLDTTISCSQSTATEKPSLRVWHFKSPHASMLVTRR